MVNFTLSSPDHSAKYEYSFFHVSSDFSAILPAQKYQVLGYPFVAGKIWFNIEDLFYGPVFEADINLQNNIPTLSSNSIQREKLELIKSYSEATVEIFLKNSEGSQGILHVFYNLNQNY